MFVQLDLLRKVLFAMSFSLLVMSKDKKECDDIEDCKTCTSHQSWIQKQCRWCPLTLTCHASGSPENQCLEKQNIIDAAQCENRTIGRYDPEEAFEYMLSCSAAYVDTPQKCLNITNPKGNFMVYETFAHPCEDLPLFKYKVCYAYIAVSIPKNVILLAFRGSESDDQLQLFDEIVSILVRPMVPFPAGGKVQGYFLKAHDLLYPCVNKSISTLIEKYPGYRVVVTGHSLGAALASLAAVSLIHEKVVPGDRLVLYNFGSPRVGDKQYALMYDKLVHKSWRVVHYRDIVSHLPLRMLSPLNGPFHHGVEIFYPNEIMKVDSEHIQCVADEDNQCSNGYMTGKECVTHIRSCITYHRYYFGKWVANTCN